MFFRQFRRRRLLAQQFPVEWEAYLRRNVTHYRYLSADEQSKLRNDLRIFIAEKYWEGCRGLQVTDEMKVTIAAQACLLVLAIPHNYYGQVQTILIYERTYRVPRTRYFRGGLVLEGDDPVIGTAHYRGPVLLSWAAVQEPVGPHNVVLHEFAHQLDFLNGYVDGTPVLETLDAYAQWREVMTAEFEQLQNDTRQGRPTLLDPYGATDEAEFFAVATECFFEQSQESAKQHPRLYELLRNYYRQDPAARCARGPQG